MVLRLIADDRKRRLVADGTNYSAGSTVTAATLATPREQPLRHTKYSYRAWLDDSEACKDFSKLPNFFCPSFLSDDGKHNEEGSANPDPGGHGESIR